MIHLTESDDPAIVIVWDDEGSGTRYRVNMSNPYSPWCPCPAYLQDCKHAVAALHWLTNKLEDPQVTQETESKALAPSQTMLIPSTSQHASVTERAQDIRQRALLAGETWMTLIEISKQWIAASIVPWDDPATGAIVMLKALELDIPLTAAVDYIDVIDRRPRLRGKMCAALVISRGGNMRFLEYGPEQVVAVSKRDGKETKITLNIANIPGTLKNRDNWKQWPADMLVGKVQFRLAHLVWPDKVMGMDIWEHGESMAADAGDAFEVTVVDADGTEQLAAIETDDPAQDTRPEMIEMLGELMSAAKPPFDWPDVERIDGYPPDADNVFDGILRFCADVEDDAAAAARVMRGLALLRGKGNGTPDAAPVQGKWDAAEPGPAQSSDAPAEPEQASYTDDEIIVELRKVMAKKALEDRDVSRAAGARTGPEVATWIRTQMEGPGGQTLAAAIETLCQMAGPAGDDDDRPFD